MPAPLITAIVVAELPALRRVDAAPKAASGAADAHSQSQQSSEQQVQPRFVLVLPHGDPAKLPKNVLPFCYPDLDQLARYPFAYENSAEEYTFTLTPKDEPRVHGFCRRYRLGSETTGGRLDLTPYTSADRKEASEAPSYQCIAILSERPYHRFFSQCLQLLHTARLAGGGVAMKVARMLLQYNAAPPGAILPLRGLFASPQVPGCLGLPRERLRLPPSIGLPHIDTPLTPLLMRLDAPALLMLYVAMLCQRRVMFVSASLSTLTSAVHAAVALLAPFEWQHIFIPVMSTPFLPYCCAPNPYLVGLTPAQFTQLNDDYDIGEVVLVALDDGYVACLNGSLPLVDMEHSGPPAVPLPSSGPAPSGSGYVSYSGPRLSQEKAISKVSGTTAATGGIDSPLGPSSSGSSSIGSGVEPLSPGPSLAATGAADSPGLSSPGVSTNSSSGSSVTSVLSGMFPPSLSGPALDVVLAPWHAPGRSHAYDDDAVMARAQRKAYMMRRVAARKAARDRVLRLYNKEPLSLADLSGWNGANGSIEEADEDDDGGEGEGDFDTEAGTGDGDHNASFFDAAGSGGGDWGNLDHSSVTFGSGSNNSVTGRAAASAKTTGGWGSVDGHQHTVTSSSSLAAAAASIGAGSTPLSPLPNSRPVALRNPAAVVTPGGADHVAAASKRRPAHPHHQARTSSNYLSSSTGGGAGAVPAINSASAAMLASLTGVALEAACPSPDMELEGSIAAEYGAVSLPVDLHALTSRPGDTSGGRHRRGSRPRGSMAPLSGSDVTDISGSGGNNSSMLKRAAMATMARAGKAVWSMATGTAGGPSSDDPCARLAYEVRQIYARERKEGCFDEPALMAAVLAFVAVVFGRTTDFVTVEGTADLAVGSSKTMAAAGAGGGGGSSSPTAPPALEPRFAKEDFVRLGLAALGPKYANGPLGRLLEEVQHSQTLQAFACDAYLRQVAARRDANTAGGSGPRLNVVDAALAEATSGAHSGISGTGSVGATAGSSYSGISGSGGGTIGSNSSYNHHASFGAGGSYGGGGTFGSGGSGGGTYGAGSTAAAALLAGVTASYGAVLRRTSQVLTSALTATGTGTGSVVPDHPLPDLPAGSMGSDRGIAGSQYSLTTALAGLAWSGGTVAASSGGLRPPALAMTSLPDPPPAVVVTALRTLLTAVTVPASQPLPEDPSPQTIARILIGASHDPALLPVVLGVLWARLNDCADKHWAQGYRALHLLDLLLRCGSPRVLALSLPFLPLLRFLMHPIRTLAVRAGYCAEEMGAQAHTAAIVAAANVVARGRKGLFGGVGGSGAGSGSSVTPVSGLTLAPSADPHLSSLSPRDGAVLVARAAGRVYCLLNSPQRWMRERALAAGPVALSNGAPLPLPLPWPLTPLHASECPGAAGCPPGWLPSQTAPHPPSMPPPPLPLTSHALTPALTSVASGANTSTGGLEEGRAGGQWAGVPPPPPPVQGNAAAAAPAPPVAASGPLGPPVQRQPRATDAPWEQVHKVAIPPMTSSRARALTSLARQQQQQQLGEGTIIRPSYVREAIAAARAGTSDAGTACSAVADGSSAGKDGSQTKPVFTSLSAALKAGPVLLLPQTSRGGGGGGGGNSITSTSATTAAAGAAKRPSITGSIAGSQPSSATSASSQAGGARSVAASNVGPARSSSVTASVLATTTVPAFFDAGEVSFGSGGGGTPVKPAAGGNNTVVKSECEFDVFRSPPPPQPQAQKNEPAASASSVPSSSVAASSGGHDFDSWASSSSSSSSSSSVPKSAVSPEVIFGTEEVGFGSSSATRSESVGANSSVGTNSIAAATPAVVPVPAPASVPAAATGGSNYRPRGSSSSSRSIPSISEIFGQQQTQTQQQATASSSSSSSGSAPIAAAPASSAPVNSTSGRPLAQSTAAPAASRKPLASSVSTTSASSSDGGSLLLIGPSPIGSSSSSASADLTHLFGGISTPVPVPAAAASAPAVPVSSGSGATTPRATTAASTAPKPPLAPAAAPAALDRPSSSVASSSVASATGSSASRSSDFDFDPGAQPSAAVKGTASSATSSSSSDFGNLDELGGGGFGFGKANSAAGGNSKPAPPVGVQRPAPATLAPAPSDDPFSFDSFVLPPLPPRKASVTAPANVTPPAAAPFGSFDFDSFDAPAAKPGAGSQSTALTAPSDDPFAF